MTDRIKYGFQKFADRTSVHGIFELYSSTSVLWTGLWIVILGCAFGATSLQVYSAISQYTQQSTTTVIILAKENEILYPPLRLCHNHWLFWVDWKKSMNLNYTKEAVLFSLSYAYNIVSSKWFNVNDAKNQFLQIMARNNMTSILTFYKSIAKQFHVSYYNEKEKETESIQFDKIDIVYSSNMYLYCYTLSEDKIFEILNGNKSNEAIGSRRINKELIFDVQDQTYDNFKDYISINEYNAYMKWYIESNSEYKIDVDQPNYTLQEYAPIVTLFPDAYSKKVIKILSDNNAYNVDFRASACFWKNKPEYRCAEQVRSLSTNDTCKFLCDALLYKASCTCQYIDKAIALNEDEFNKVCMNAITFWTGSDNVNVTVVNNRLFNHYNEAIICWFDSDDDNYNVHESCLKKCVEACQIWTYDFSVSILASSAIVRRFARKNVTKIVINYPSGTDIVVMKEIDAQSWDNFVGNVGGLLGIWTGASIVSLFQFFYLCCCYNVDNK